VKASCPRDTAGSALVEALVALVLIAIAGLMVATATANGLRASARASTLSRTTAYAAGELAALANLAATATGTTTARPVSGFTGSVACTTDVARDGALVALAVDVEAGRPAERVRLSTQRLLEVDE
jgi:Tfp pilus assembly protein PilV